MQNMGFVLALLVAMMATMMELEESHNPRPFLNTVVAHLCAPARVQMFCNHLCVKRSKRRNILVSIKTSDKEGSTLQCGKYHTPVEEICFLSPTWLVSIPTRGVYLQNHTLEQRCVLGRANSLEWAVNSAMMHKIQWLSGGETCKKESKQYKIVLLFHGWSVLKHILI